MKNIYWKGKIYENLIDQQHTMFDLSKWKDARVFQLWLDELLDSIPVSGSHDFKDGQEVVKGVDYKIVTDTWCDDDGYGKLIGEKYDIAIQKNKK